SINLELLFLIKGLIYAGYIKIKNRADASIKRKEELYSLIEGNPGLHYRELQRKSFLKNGTFEYHINQMESEGLIKSVKDKSKVRYFTTGFELSPDKLKYISVMKTESLRKIIFLIYFNVSMNNTEIADELELSKSVISENLKYLCEANIIEAKKTGKFTYYNVSDKYSDRIFEYISNKSMIEKNIFSTDTDNSSLNHNS
ncbi:MAG: winged helix-turn-helix transcriptional regulator, partial [Methanomicrobium sp.]|nr:winged helix-turn-helix transcriptional regulator [Methanomicrobium sp.]